MKEFEDAFQAGILAARAVEYKRHEIRSVLNEFSASLELATKGALGVELKTLMASTNALRALLDPSPRKQWLAVVIKATPAKSESVAEWRQSPDGYPCTIVTADQEYVCFDRVALKDELARLAASPQMGSVIVRLLKLREEG